MRWFIAIVMVLHGLIHLMGGFNELGLARIKEISGKTLFPFPEMVHIVFGAAWLLAVVLFIASAIGILSKRDWWRGVAIISIMVSQILIVIWWPAAKWGTVANVLVMISLMLIKNKGQTYGLRGI